MTRTPSERCDVPSPFAAGSRKASRRQSRTKAGWLAGITEEVLKDTTKLMALMALSDLLADYFGFQRNVIALSQLNRQVENRPDARPRLSDLRESGAIEQDADQTWLLWRPNKGSTDQSDTVASIDIAKNRNGPTDLINLEWHGPTSSFRNLDSHDRANELFRTGAA